MARCPLHRPAIAWERTRATIPRISGDGRDAGAETSQAWRSWSRLPREAFQHVEPGVVEPVQGTDGEAFEQDVEFLRPAPALRCGD